jgi:transposase-like protein
MSMTGKIDRVEVVTSVQRRRRWSAEEKARIVQETYAPGMSVSVIARQCATTVRMMSPTIRMKDDAGGGRRRA